MFEISIWILSFVLICAGILGLLIPVVPGTSLIFAAALLNKLCLPGYLSWWSVAIVGALALLAHALGLLVAPLGAKRFGATRWGMLGASLGTIAGLFFSLPGLILGPILGAFIAEMVVARRHWKDASKAGVGATLGLLAAGILQIFVALGMVGILAFDWFVIK